MSEFTYACPVCGQHIKCDSSQAGSIMECPTCFQKVIAPQAPTDPNSKFVLTGQKYVKYKTTVASGPEGVKTAGIRTPPLGAARPPGKPVPAKETTAKKFPVTIVLVVVLLLGAGAGVFFLKDKIFSKSKFESKDIGAVQSPGSFNANDTGTFSVSGSGSDVWGSSDSFHFVYKPMDGDFKIVTRVLSVSESDAWAKGGLMIRDSLEPDASFVDFFLSPNRAAPMHQRDNAGSPVTVVHDNWNVSAPRWFRLERSGYRITGSISSDGVTWKESGTATVIMGRHVYAGLMVCAHNASRLCTAVFDNVYIGTANPSSTAGSASSSPQSSGGDNVVHLSFDNLNGNVVPNSGAGGSSLDGTVVGDIGLAPGKFGNALKLDGRGGHKPTDIVLVNDKGVATDADGNWTVAFWVKTTTPGATILYQGDGGWNDGATTFYLNRGNADPGGNRAGAVRYGGGWFTGTATIDDGTWHHVALVDSGGTQMIYIDGNIDLVGGMMAHSLSGNANQLWIGGSPDPTDNAVRMVGLIDEVWMFNRSLSQQEVQSLMQKNKIR